MPANKKYLTSLGWIRALKIFNGFVGGFLMAQAFHLFLSLFLDEVNVIIFSSITIILVWPVFILLAFYFKSAWKGLLLYFGISLGIFALIYFL